jgi:hypothetical protein
MKHRIAVLALAPLLLAAGCESVGTAGGQSSTSPRSSAPIVTQPPVPPGSAGQDTSQPQSQRCRTGELKITAQGAPGGGAAGNLYVWLVFTNVSARTCSLYGYPGVSWVTGPAGRQVNDPVRRTTDLTPARVVLAPQASAHAVLQQGQPGAFEPNCHAVQAAGFRVYPPDETASVFVAWAAPACSANGVDVGAVSPIMVSQ